MSRTATTPLATYGAVKCDVKWCGRAVALHDSSGTVLCVVSVALSVGSRLFETFQRAGVEAGYGERNKDYNAQRQEGFAPMPMTVFHSGPRRGERCSTATAYLEPALQARSHLLQVWTQAHAGRVLWDNTVEGGNGVRATPTARGVVCTDGRIAVAKREVILAAGAIASPQLLQVSGVGDEQHLSGIGVECVVHLPGVGQNLQDHLEVYFQYACQSDSLRPWLSLWRKALIGARWLLCRDFLGATNHFEAAGFIRSGAGVEYPDIQFHFLPVAVSYDGVTSPDTPTGHSFQLHVGHNRSTSRGSVLATSNDIAVAPKCNFNYMSTEHDWQTWRKVLRLSREIIAQPAFDGLRGDEISPGGHAQSDAELDAYLREHLESAYHPCGTCKMGADGDAMAVVDSAGRVHGTQRLRVVDSSVFPLIPNGNLNAPTIMTAEKLADAILARAPLPPLSAALRQPRGWVSEHWRTEQREHEPKRRVDVGF